MNVERVAISSLAEDPANVRKHSEKNIHAIKGSLQRFGQQKPIVVDGKGVVRAGNGTLEAARALGWSEIDVVRTTLEGVEAAAYAIADNRTAELAEWDSEGLAKLLDEIRQQDEALVLAAGFDDLDMAKMIPPAPLDDDVVPDRPADPITKPGDLLCLGLHRVLCGDSTVEANVERALGGAAPFLMVTDPPYGVEYDPSWRNEAGVSSTERTGRVANDDRVDWTDAWRLFRGGVAYVWHAGRHCGEVAANLHSAGMEIRAQLIWAKNRFALSRGNYHWQHEPCWYAVRQGQSAKWVGDRRQSTVWSIERTDDGDATVHGTQKPIECMARPMRNHDAAEVYDPFLGSGTTLVAAEKLGRTCFGLEIDAGYCDVIADRWSRITGGTVERIPAQEAASVGQ